LIFFAQLRIADEFKDCEEDAKYRPYRPVPRGLVTLGELGVMFALGGAVQLGLALWLEPKLALLLVGVWAYLAAMCREFGARRFLKGRPVLYMVSHMAIMPLIDLYATSTDFLVAGESAPSGLGWFLLASFFNGMVIEIGRKIRAPEDEEHGVETYSALWGRRNAILAWWLVAALTLTCGVMAGAQIDHTIAVAALLAMAMIGVLVAGARFLVRHPGGAGRQIESICGLWTLVLYLSLGLIPLIDRLWA
jgi:4-hydroxybenzoate polyprenyltransferase